MRAVREPRMMRVAREPRRRQACSCCLGSLLKLFNTLLAFVGLALCLFAIWNLCKLADSLNFQYRSVPIFSTQWELPDAWFTYFLLGLGVAVCFISLLGHLAAETSNGCCLSSYVFFLIMLGMLQAFAVAEICLNPDWEKMIPSDPTGVWDNVEKFVEDNLVFCKWIGLAILLIELLAVMSALCTRAAIPDWQSYDSDDEYVLPQTSLRTPLLLPRRAATDGAVATNTGTVEGWPVNR